MMMKIMMMMMVVVVVVLSIGLSFAYTCGASGSYRLIRHMRTYVHILQSRSIDRAIDP
jgi:hypothetical protein